MPESVIDEGLVATMPPVNAIVSEPFPKVSVPVLLKVVVPAMVFELPVRETL